MFAPWSWPGVSQLGGPPTGASMRLHQDAGESLRFLLDRRLVNSPAILITSIAKSASLQRLDDDVRCDTRPPSSGPRWSRSDSRWRLDGRTVKRHEGKVEGAIRDEDVNVGGGGGFVRRRIGIQRGNRPSEGSHQ